ncbi:MAG: metal-dependent transcriptional regulator [Anaerolineales bacterium]
MIRERAEAYLGAIYRLRVEAETPVALSKLGEYFDFSPVSIHEMVKKLADQGWLVYHPYRGVTLTERGEQIAASLLRRHRLWERFLTDVLAIPWGEAHEIASELEHAASEVVTERLAAFLGEPAHCPHGGPIPPLSERPTDQALNDVTPGARGRITRIAPESTPVLHSVQELGLLPETKVRVIRQQEGGTMVQIGGCEVRVSTDIGRAIWIEAGE